MRSSTGPPAPFIVTDNSIVNDNAAIRCQTFSSTSGMFLTGTSRAFWIAAALFTLSLERPPLLKRVPCDGPSVADKRGFRCFGLH
jgi:hypothetical protein